MGEKSVARNDSAVQGKCVERFVSKIDKLDAKILRALQSDASQSIAELAEKIGLSTNACWKRVKRLDDEGFILRRVALLDRSKINQSVTAFVEIRTDQHEEEWLEQFADAVRAIPEIVEFYRLSGQVDYMLKIVCSDIADYDRIYKKLIRNARLRDVSSYFAMEQLKYTTELPVGES